MNTEHRGQSRFASDAKRVVVKVVPLSEEAASEAPDTRPGQFGEDSSPLLSQAWTCSLCLLLNSPDNRVQYGDCDI